jgi:5-methylcytosine-specific restriction endonuclease McrA
VIGSVGVRLASPRISFPRPDPNPQTVTSSTLYRSHSSASRSSWPFKINMRARRPYPPDNDPSLFRPRPCLRSPGRVNSAHSRRALIYESSSTVGHRHSRRSCAICLGDKVEPKSPSLHRSIDVPCLDAYTCAPIAPRSFRALLETPDQLRVVAGQGVARVVLERVSNKPLSPQRGGTSTYGSKLSYTPQPRTLHLDDRFPVSYWVILFALLSRLSGKMGEPQVRERQGYQHSAQVPPASALVVGFRGSIAFRRPALSISNCHGIERWTARQIPCPVTPSYYCLMDGIMQRASWRVRGAKKSVASQLLAEGG